MSDFTLKITPELTLSDTKISYSGVIETGDVYGTDKQYDYAQLAKDWVKQHRAHWGNDYGVVSHLSPSVIKPRIISPSVQIKPLALSHHLFDNSDSNIPATYTAELSDTVTDETSVDWNESVSASYSLSLEVGVGSFAKATATASLSATVGHDVSRSKTLEIGSKDGIAIDVPANTIQLAILFLEQGLITLNLELYHAIRGYLNLESGGVNPERVTLLSQDVQPYSLEPVIRSQVSLKFAGQSEIKNVTISDDSPSTVDNAIANVLEGHIPNDTELVKTLPSILFLEQVPNIRQINQILTEIEDVETSLRDLIDELRALVNPT